MENLYTHLNELIGPTSHQHHLDEIEPGKLLCWCGFAAQYTKDGLEITDLPDDLE